jgi:hypothetical protein
LGAFQERIDALRWCAERFAQHLLIARHGEWDRGQ